MELVYLWVEDYKNIHQQGFNFSPRFECKFHDEYDEDGKLKDNCKLEICDKKKNECEDNDYIENFFGENINVTAIVGKNGSGKSSLIKLIFMLIYYKKHSSEDENIYITLIKQKYINNLFLIVIDKEGNYRKITFNQDITSNKPCIQLEDIDFFSVYFNYIADSWYDNFEDDWVNQIYHKTDNYKTPLLLQPNKQDKNTLANVINIDMITYLNSQRILQFYAKIDMYKSITNFFSPKTIQISDTNKTSSYSSNGDHVEFKKIGKLGQQLLKIAHKYNFKLNYKGSNNLLNEIKKLEDDNNFEYINQLYITFKVLLSDEALFDKKIYTRIKGTCEKSMTDDELILQTDLVIVDEFDDLIIKDASEYEVFKLKKCFDFQTNKIYEKNKFKDLFNGNTLDLRNENVKKILNNIPPWINIDFLEDDKSLETLSSGEKALFAIIVNIMYQFQNINGENYNTINIFLDETELGLHPNWQKKYLIDILESIKPLNIKNKKINFIFATHSPFLLSDLPKENVMFLKDGKQDKGTEKKQTFGANIHTLLSDSFFMEDGLMGEYAKGKIDKAIILLNQEKLSEEDLKYCEKIISIIGEPIVKNQLQRMIDSKKISYLAKDTREEIEFLKHRIDLLSNRL